MRDEDLKEVERRLGAAARATDDLVRGWSDTRGAPDDAGSGAANVVDLDARRHRMRRVLYPVASAAAVAAVVVGAITLTNRDSGSHQPVAGGPPSSISSSGTMSSMTTKPQTNAVQAAQAAMVAAVPGLRNVTVARNLNGYTVMGRYYQGEQWVAVATLVVSRAAPGATLANPCKGSTGLSLGGRSGFGASCTQIVHSDGTIWIRKSATSPTSAAKVWTVEQIRNGAKVVMTVSSDRGQVLGHPGQIKQLPWTIAQQRLVDLVSSSRVQVGV